MAQSIYTSNFYWLITPWRRKLKMCWYSITNSRIIACLSSKINYKYYCKPYKICCTYSLYNQTGPLSYTVLCCDSLVKFWQTVPQMGRRACEQLQNFCPCFQCDAEKWNKRKILLTCLQSNTEQKHNLITTKLLFKLSKSSLTNYFSFFVKFLN